MLRHRRYRLAIGFAAFGLVAGYLSGPILAQCFDYNPPAVNCAGGTVIKCQGKCSSDISTSNCTMKDYIDQGKIPVTYGMLSGMTQMGQNANFDACLDEYPCRKSATPCGEYPELHSMCERDSNNGGTVIWINPDEPQGEECIFQ